MDWPKNILLNNRGGFFKSNIKYKNNELHWQNNRGIRKYPCCEPLYFIGIDYNGNIVPCCQIRSDNPSHKDYILGNINENLLTDIYYGKKAKCFRATVSTTDYKQYPHPCRHCQKKTGRYTRDNPGIFY
jgi:radical SAM protein with 4Fe4S-binding SPASM domain